MTVVISQDELDNWYVAFYCKGKLPEIMGLSESKGLQECYNLVELLDKFKVTKDI